MFSDKFISIGLKFGSLSRRRLICIISVTLKLFIILFRVVLLELVGSVFIHSGHFYSAAQVHYYSETLPTQNGYCAGVSRKGHRQLRVKDLPKVPTWRLERDSNPRPFGRKASNLPMRHNAPWRRLVDNVEKTLGSIHARRVLAYGCN